MGYNLYITRRSDWFDEDGPEITLEEWREFVASEPELHIVPHPSFSEGFTIWDGHPERDDPWIAWDDGNIESKNPDEPLIKKMVAIASALDARVVGDEGEVYGESGEPVETPEVVEPERPAARGFFQRLRSWWAKRESAGPEPVKESDLPFSVGSRVHSPWGQAGTVTVIDVKANHGAGKITVLLDDGREVSSLAFAHGLDPMEEQGDEG